MRGKWGRMVIPIEMDHQAGKEVREYIGQGADLGVARQGHCGWRMMGRRHEWTDGGIGGTGDWSSLGLG